MLARPGDPPPGTGATAAQIAAALDGRGLLRSSLLAEPDRPIRTVQIVEPAAELLILPGAAVIAVGASAPAQITEVIARTAESEGVAIVRAVENVELPTEPPACLIMVAESAGWLDIITVVRDMVAGARDVFDDEETDLFGVAEAVARLLGAPVTIEDDAGALVGYSSDQTGGDSTRVATIMARRTPAHFNSALVASGLRRTIAGATGPVAVRNVLPDTHDRVALPLRSSGISLGTMWVVIRDIPTSARQSVLDFGRQAEQLMFRRRTEADRTRRIELEELATLLHGGAPLTAGNAGHLPSGVHRVGAIEVVPTDPAARAVVRSRLEQRLSHLDGPGGLTLRGGQLSDLYYVILSVPADRSPDSSSIAAWLRQGLTDRASGTLLDVHVGIGRPVRDVRELPLSRREAEQAMNVDRHSTGSSAWNLEACWARAVLLKVLDAGARAELDALSPLRLLRQHDREHHTAFVASLREWLRAQGNYRSAADALHIHANTLRYRIERIAEVAALDLGDPDIRLVLELQLHAGSL